MFRRVLTTALSRIGSAGATQRVAMPEQWPHHADRSGFSFSHNCGKPRTWLTQKSTAGVIPLRHVLPLDAVEPEFAAQPRGVRVVCTVRTQARTGVEMEALTGAMVAALTLYDMCKAADKKMRVEGVRVVEKRKAGG